MNDEETIADLRKQLADAKDALSLAINDREVERTRVMRMLKSEADRMVDALHAVRNGRYEVVEEFIDRNISAMTEERYNLTNNW